jgi:hypothetical protein
MSGSWSGLSNRLRFRRRPVDDEEYSVPDLDLAAQAQLQTAHKLRRIIG